MIGKFRVVICVVITILFLLPTSALWITEVKAESPPPGTFGNQDTFDVTIEHPVKEVGDALGQRTAAYDLQIANFGSNPKTITFTLPPENTYDTSKWTVVLPQATLVPVATSSVPVFELVSTITPEFGFLVKANVPPNDPPENSYARILLKATWTSGSITESHIVETVTTMDTYQAGMHLVDGYHFAFKNKLLAGTVQPVVYDFTVTNYGKKQDTFDLISSAIQWDVEFFSDDSCEPIYALQDTNSNLYIDTGPLAPWVSPGVIAATTQVYMKVTPPPSAQPYNQGTITVIADSAGDGLAYDDPENKNNDKISSLTTIADILYCVSDINGDAWYNNLHNVNPGESSTFVTKLSNPNDYQVEINLDIITHPVFGWYDEFLFGCNIEGHKGLFIADIDNDNDDDIVAIRTWYGDAEVLIWYENGNNWDDHGIGVKSTGGYSNIYAGHINNDGNIDLVVIRPNSVIWYEAPDDPTDWWIEHDNIDNSLDGASDAYIGDINGDNYLDIVAIGNNEIAWYENDGTPTDSCFGTKYIIKSGISGGNRIIVARVDSGTTWDVIASTSSSIFWLENNGNPTTVPWPIYYIDTNNGADDICLAMIEDIVKDLVAINTDSNEVVWYDRPSPATGNWQRYPIDTIENPTSVTTSSSDDVIVTTDSRIENVVIYENDGTPEDGGWIKYVVDNNLEGAIDAAYCWVNGESVLFAIGERYPGYRWYEKPWGACLSEYSKTLNGGETEDINLIVRIPPDASINDYRQVKVQATIEDPSGELLQDIITVEVQVESHHKVYIINIDALAYEYLLLDMDGNIDNPNDGTPKLMPALDLLINGGIISVNGQSVQISPGSSWTQCYDCIPAITDPNHSGIVTSARPGTTGIYSVGTYYRGWNDEKKEIIMGGPKFTDLQAETIFKSIKNTDRNLKTAAVLGKHFVGPLWDDGSNLDILAGGPEHDTAYYIGEPQPYFLGDPTGGGKTPFESTSMTPNIPGDFEHKLPSDEYIMDSTIEIINHEDPDIMYILLSCADDAGHVYGSAWDPNIDPNSINLLADPENMLDVVKMADEEVLRFIIFLAERLRDFNNVMIMVTADHGMNTVHQPYKLSGSTLIQQSADIKDYLYQNGIKSHGVDYDFLFSEGPIVYLYGFDSATTRNTAKQLLDPNSANPYTLANGVCPIWQVLDQADMQNGFNPYTGQPWGLYNQHCDNQKTDRVTIKLPDLMVFMDFSNGGLYDNFLYADALRAGGNALAIPVDWFPSRGKIDVPGNHGTWNEQHVPLIGHCSGNYYGEHPEILSIEEVYELPFSDPILVGGWLFYPFGVPLVELIDIIPSICNLNSWPLPANAEGDVLVTPGDVFSPFGPVLPPDGTRYYLGTSRTCYFLIPF